MASVSRSAVAEATGAKLLFTLFPCSSLPSHSPARLCSFRNALSVCVLGLASDADIAAVRHTTKTARCFASLILFTGCSSLTIIVMLPLGVNDKAPTFSAILFLVKPRRTENLGPSEERSRSSRRVVILADPPVEELDIVGPWEVFESVNNALRDQGRAYQ